MMNLKQTLAIVIVLSLLTALAFGGLAAIDYISSLYMSLDPQLARVSTILLLIVLLVTWAISRSLRNAAAQKMRQQLKEEISTTYQYFLDYWIVVMDQGHQFDKTPEAQHDLDKLMALYGGADAIKTHLELRTMVQKKDMQPAEMRTQFGKALLAIRKDLGADSPGLSAKDLVQLVLPEPNPDVDIAHLPQSKTETERASGA